MKIFKFKKLNLKLNLPYLSKLFLSKFFISILFIICFSLLAIFGIKSRWGASINHKFKGTDTLLWSNDVGNEAKITLSYPKNLNENEKSKVENILKKRLHLAGFGENKIYFDQNNKFIIINMPLSYNKPLFDFNDIAEYLVSPGKLRIIKTFKDEISNLFGFDQQNKKEEFLMDNNAVNSVSLKYTKNKISKSSSKNNIPSIEFNLSEEGKEKLLERYNTASQKRKELFYLEKETKNLQKEVDDLEEASGGEKNEKTKEQKEKEKVLDEKRSKIKNLKTEISSETIEIQLDEHSVYSGNILELIDENNKVMAASITNTPKQVLSYVNIISSNNLNIPLSVVDIIAKSPTINSNVQEKFLIFMSIIIILISILISLKLFVVGLVGLVTVIGHLCFIIACFSGFFSFLPGFCVNISSMIATSLSILIGFSFILYLQRKILSYLEEGNGLNISIEETFKDKNYKTLSKLNGLIMLVSVVLMGVFAPKNDILYFIFSQLNMAIDANTQNAIFSFFYAVFVGSIAIFIFELFFTKFILKSAAQLKLFNKSFSRMEAKK